MPLLLPDTPVVAWWPFEAPPVPAKDPIGCLANRRITDSANERNPIKALEQRRSGYAPGDTDLAWTRLTNWRAMLAAALDLPPSEKVASASVIGELDSPSTDLLAAWLAARLRIPVSRLKAPAGHQGMYGVTLERRSGNVDLQRPDGRIGILVQAGQPDRRVALHRRSDSDCLAEELRRLDDDEIYAEALRALPKVTRGRAPTKTAARSTATKPKPAAATKTPAKAPAPAKKPAPRKTKATAAAKGKAAEGSAS
jgi:glucose-6-phosphate dehydrogenase assembly protein OpcA